MVTTKASALMFNQNHLTASSSKTPWLPPAFEVVQAHNTLGGANLASTETLPDDYFSGNGKP
jgi:hypothetical protein